MLVWLLAVEGIIRDVLHGSAFVRWLPVAVAHTLVRAGSAGPGPSVSVAAAAFTAYVAAFATAATRWTIQRDIT